MSDTPLRVLALGPRDDSGLIASYARAYEELGSSVTCWDLNASLRRHARLGRLGQIAIDFLNVEPWVAKANRELIVEARRVRPHLLLVAGAVQIRAGAIAQIKTALPDCKVVLLWPDPLVNVAGHVIDCLPIYDLSATYSMASVPNLIRLGAHAAEWVPFAADPALYPSRVDVSPSERRQFDCDVCFVGNHRPERERAVLALRRAGISVKVWGENTWESRAADRSEVSRYWQGRPLFGADFSKAVHCARVSLNVIDDTNYPAANMRFFENPTCGGAAPLNSACPEMTNLFPDRVSSMYFDDEASLVQATRELLRDERLRTAIATTAHEQVLREHTYVHRARQILSALGSPAMLSPRASGVAKRLD